MRGIQSRPVRSRPPTLCPPTMSMSYLSGRLLAPKFLAQNPSASCPLLRRLCRACPPVHRAGLAESWRVALRRFAGVRVSLLCTWSFNCLFVLFDIKLLSLCYNVLTPTRNVLTPARESLRNVLTPARESLRNVLTPAKRDKTEFLTVLSSLSSAFSRSAVWFFELFKDFIFFCFD